MGDGSQRKYDVALSYDRGEQRYVNAVAKHLEGDGYKVFFDRGDEGKRLNDRNLLDELQQIFSEQTHLAVLFLSDGFKRNPWCDYERKVALAHAHDESRADQDDAREPFVVLGRFDDAKIKGVVSTQQHVDLRVTKSKAFARHISNAIRKRKAVFEKPSSKEKLYGLVFGFPEYWISYIPIPMGPWYQHYHQRDSKNLTINVLHGNPFELPASLRDMQPSRSDYQELLRCRLNSYNVDGHELNLEFSPTWYSDYLRSSDSLSLRTRASGNKSLRQVFLERLGDDGAYLAPFKELTNICGIGLFIITRDERLVVTRHSLDSHVYPGRLTFSASGSMPWGASAHPFVAVYLKARDELGHLVDPKKVKLFAFGADSRKLYFQFSFVEDANVTFHELNTWFQEARERLRKRSGARMRASVDPAVEPKELVEIPLNNERVICDKLIGECWEPSAEAALLALLAERFGRDAVERALRRRRGDWWRRTMRDEWDARATRPGLLADMSGRYRRPLEQESREYVNAVMKFMQAGVRGKRVVEIGPGTGSISARLIKVADSLTCVELCPLMMARLKARLRGSKVDFIEDFAQDYLNGKKKFDVAVTSLVLCHNVGDAEFEALVNGMCSSAATIFVFEDVSRRTTSPATRLRDRRTLQQAFIRRGFVVVAHQDYRLFQDQILFLHLARKAGHRAA